MGVLMTIQLTYHNTRLVPDDVIAAHELGKLENFDCPYPNNYWHWMIYPKQFPGVKIQIMRESANIWMPDFNQRDKVEDLLNEIFGDRANPMPFKDAKLMLKQRETEKILETPLGLLSQFGYCNPLLIKEAVDQYVKCVDIPANSFGKPYSNLRNGLSTPKNIEAKKTRTKSDQLFPSIFDYF
jgi:hypothetical protein